MDAELRRAERTIAYQNIRFILAHQNDTLEQLSDYLSACMDALGHAPARTEVLGGDFIELRFGSWAKALRSIGQSGFDDTQQPPRVQSTQLFRDEFDRQQALDRQKKLEKKAIARERMQRDKAACKAAKEAKSNPKTD